MLDTKFIYTAYKILYHPDIVMELLKIAFPGMYLKTSKTQNEMDFIFKQGRGQLNRVRDVELNPSGNVVEGEFK